MKVANVLLLLSLLALILFDVAQSRRSRSKNSIKKRNQRLNEKRNKHTRNKTLKKENSRNAFQNSDIIRALEIIEEEVMQQDYHDEEVAKDDYYYDEPIIHIRFKRDEALKTYQQKEYKSNSILIQRLQETL